MAEITLNGSGFGNPLLEIMACDAISPGDAPSYQTCKLLYEYHPLGAKLVEAPISMAQFKAREIEITVGPKERVKDAFLAEWKKLDATAHIFNLMRQSRMYGIASLALLIKGQNTDTPLDFTTLYQADIAFSVFDPLITAGSLVFNQNANDMDFLKTTGDITAQGQLYHRSRVVVKLNEEPIFLGYTTSAFGYVGRSVYQRTLYPLRSFLQSMRTDDLVTRKAGIIVAKMKPAGSIVNQMMQTQFGLKRNVVKEAQTDNVISISNEEDIEAIDLTNVNAAMETSRKNILNNIAAGAGMPAILMNEETFAEGFGEGTEDAEHVARYIDRFREEMQQAYDFFDRIVQYRAWNTEFYATIQADFPEEYGAVTYEDAFYAWQKGFTATWPSLLSEPESEKAKADDVKLKAIIAIVEILLPVVDPDNKATLVEFLADNINAMDTLFTAPLMLDYEELAAYEPPVPAAEPGQPKPFAAQDAVANLLKLPPRKKT